MWEFLKTLTDPQSIIQYGGLWLLLFVIFAETGLLVGFFLPGDNLILLAGILCKSQPSLLNVDFIPLVILMTIAAVVGNMFGYWFGKKAGERLYERKETLFFKKRHLEATNKYYLKYGGNATLILARFLPVIRTFAPIIAGVVKVNFSKFMLFNIVGAVLWIFGLASIGYYLVTLFPGITNYMGYIFITLIILTAIPVLRLIFKKKENSTV
ncbi:MAG: VTT domain-containing protein [Sphingobacteriaceae bacterium]|nr:VTT domain-containing protein [Sphingobacteriaceae bacterium]